MKTPVFRKILMTFLVFAFLPAAGVAQAMEALYLDRIGEEAGIPDDEIWLADVFRAMETRYGIQIRVAPQLATDRLYDPELKRVAPLPENATLEEALELAVIRNGLFYEKKADHYRITGGKSPGIHLVEKRYAVPFGDADELIDVLTDLVQQDSWDECGSGPGVYEYLPAEKTLILWQTPEVLAEVDDFFAKLTGQYVTPPGRAKLEQVLRTELTLQFPETPLGEIAKLLESRLGVPVRVDMEVIGDELGLKGHEWIESDSRDVTLASALRNMLDRLGLSYTLDGDTLLITTEEKADDKRDLRFYPRKFTLCGRRLVVDDPQEIRTMQHRTYVHPLMVGGGLVGRVVTTAPDGPPVTELYRGPVEFVQIIDGDTFLGALTSICAKKQWRDHGNENCQVHLIHGPGQAEDERFVAVLASQRVHEEVKHFIDALDGKTPWETPAMKRALAALDKTVTIQAGKDGITLAEFVRRVETQTGAKLHVDVAALEEHLGVTLTDKVYLNLVNVRADFALAAVRWGCGPVIRNESLWFTSLEKRDEGLYPQVHRVKQREADIGDWDSLIDTISVTVDKESWEDTGSGDAVITLSPNSNTAGDAFEGLLILQTYANHREIERIVRTYEGTPPPPTESETRVRDALATKVSLEYTDKPVTEIAADLQAKLGVTIFVETEYFEAELGMELEKERVSLRVKDISLENALELLCRQCAEMRMTVKDNVIHITTRERYDETLTMKMYPWKFWEPEHRWGPRFHDDLEMLFGPPRRAAFTPGFFLADTTPQAELAAVAFPPIDDRDSICDIITTLVAPGSWEETGRGNATFAPFSQWLVISQTPDGHREVGKLLRALEQKPPVRTAAEMRITQRLAEPVTWNFKEKPLADVAWELTQQLGVNVVVDTVAMIHYEHETGEELPPNPAVTSEVADMPLAEALAKMLRPLKMSFTMKHGAVLLTTAAEAKPERECRIYNVFGATDLGLDNADVMEMIARRLMLTDDETEAMEEWIFPWDRGYFYGGASQASVLDRLLGDYTKAAGWLIIHQTPAMHDVLRETLQPLEGESAETRRAMDFYDKQQQWRWQRPGASSSMGLGGGF